MLNKFLSLIGLEDTDEEEEILEEDEAEEKKPAKAASAASARKPQPRRDATRPATGSEARRPEDMADMKMVVYHPVSYDDAQQIADNLKGHRPIIVNMEELFAGRGLCARRYDQQDFPRDFPRCAAELRRAGQQRRRIYRSVSRAGRGTVSHDQSGEHRAEGIS